MFTLRRHFANPRTLLHVAATKKKQTITRSFYSDVEGVCAVTWSMSVLVSTVGGSVMLANYWQSQESSMPMKLVGGSLGAVTGAFFGFLVGATVPFGLPVAVPVLVWNHVKNKRTEKAQRASSLDVEVA